MKINLFNSFCTSLIFIFLTVCIFPQTSTAQYRRGKKVVRVKQPRRTVVVRTYPNAPRLRSTVRVVPRGARVIRHNRINYQFHNGVFYRPAGRSFVVVRPPVGIRVTTLPASRTRVVVGRRNYFYYYGNYYVAVQGGYKTVQAPVGAIVDVLPPDYEMIDNDGQSYYRYDDVHYTAIARNDGTTAYKVVRFG